MKHFNELTPAEAERLAYLIEECGEVIQACTKILRHGYKSRNPSSEDSANNQDMLEMEIADIKKALRLMFMNKDINLDRVQAYENYPHKNYFHHQS